MKKRVCYLFVFDGYSDWEPSLAIAGLHQFTDFSVKTFSVNGNSVRSMGNIQVIPDLSLEQILPSDVDLLLLPGGNGWEKGENLEIMPLLDAVLASNKAVAAICGATCFLGEQGYLNERKHTSNNLEQYLKTYAPHYEGEQHYVKQHCVRDGNLITANGTAMVEFAQEIFAHFDLFEFEELSIHDFVTFSNNDTGK
jgi:putative intracellular protease/amidase